MGLALLDVLQSFHSDVLAAQVQGALLFGDVLVQEGPVFGG